MPASFTAPVDFNYDQLVASETVSRSGVMTSGQGVVKRGTIVGTASATGKYTKTDAPTGILAEDCDATSADAPCLVYVEGKFLVTGIIWPASGSHASITEALHLRSVHILSVLADSGLLIKPDTTAVGLAVMAAVEDTRSDAERSIADAEAAAKKDGGKDGKDKELPIDEPVPGRHHPVAPEVAQAGYPPKEPEETASNNKKTAKPSGKEEPPAPTHHTPSNNPTKDRK